MRPWVKILFLVFLSSFPAEEALAAACAAVSVSSSNGNGTYSTGTIAIDVTFDVAADVLFGPPRIELETGATNKYADYASGSGTTVLTFNYVIASGDSSTDLDYVATDSLTLNGGTIKNSFNNCTLALPTPGTTGSLGDSKNIVINTTPVITQSAYRWFANQDMDPGFDGDGVLTGAAGSHVAYDVAKDSTYLYTVGDDGSDWRLEKRLLSTGALDESFGTSGIVTADSSSRDAQAIAIDGTYMYVFGDDDSVDWRIEKRQLSDGALDTGFDTDGILTSDATTGLAYDIAIYGTYLYVVGADTGDGGNLRIEKRSLSSGALDGNFDGESGGNGIIISNSSSYLGTAIAIDGTYLYVVGYTVGNDWWIEKRQLSDGALDTGFDTDGMLTSTSGSQAYDIAIDATYMYVVGSDGSSWRIEKMQLSDGALDGSFGTSGVVTADSSSSEPYAIHIDATYMYVVGKDDNNDWRIEKRALSDGALDSGFGTSGVVTGAGASNWAYDVAVGATYIHVVGDDGSDWRMEKRKIADGSLHVDITDVGAALAAANTAATAPAQGIPFRLRMLLHMTDNTLLINTGNFKLQYGAGSDCGSVSWSDIQTNSGAIQYYDNSIGTDAHTFVANANDPTHSSDTVILESYEEANTFLNAAAAIPPGDDGEWDFVLVDNSAASGTSYCFRAINSGNTDFDTYSQYPQITTLLNRKRFMVVE